MADLAEIDPTESLATLEGENLVNWSDEKKKEYCALLNRRTRVARYILLKASDLVMTIAQDRRFISEKHTRDLEHAHLDQSIYDQAATQGHNYYNSHSTTVGGRSLQDLGEIAHARAEAVLKNLPPLQQAVEIIDAETAQKIRRAEEIQGEAEPLRDQLDVVCKDIILAELPRTMTLGQLDDLITEREERRRGLVLQLNSLAREKRTLETEIARTLYAGLPGLSDAVVDTIKTYRDQAKALDASMRRIEEQVNFGDSDAALSVLRTFEQDEATISENVAARFREALDKLKLSVEKGRKGRGKKVARQLG